LWIAICLPRLPIEVHAGEGLALAIDDGRRLLHVNELARRAGVNAGMRRATGLALCPALRLLARDPARERAALQAVALWALQFTPNVSLVAPNEQQPDQPAGLLLEVDGSLRLFGGLAPIVRSVARGLSAQGHAAQISVAPVPQAAWLLARAPRDRADGIAVVSRIDELRAALQPLPVWLLGSGSRYWGKLLNIGLRTIGDLLALPRSGAARRFSEALLDELDRALGERPDPRDWFAAPAAFDLRVELAARVDSAEALLFAARRLLMQLAGWLASRHAATRTMVFSLVHGERPPTPLPLHLADASNDDERFVALLREVLGRTQLPAPVYELGLRCTDVVAARPSPGRLFPAPHVEHEALMRLLERLQARLGRRQVTRLGLHEDHRPELAFTAGPAAAADGGAAGASMPASMRPMRPLWLLPEPVALAERNNAPVHGTPLTLVSGPERIEGGWWDGAWAERDYFVARDGEHALLWIFRLRSPAPGARQGWYLHGKFG
jgi:protein ImuB